MTYDLHHLQYICSYLREADFFDIDSTILVLSRIQIERFDRQRDREHFSLHSWHAPLQDFVSGGAVSSVKKLKIKKQKIKSFYYVYCTTMEL
jgi:hypothetical protein